MVWWLTVIVAGALAVGMFAMVSPTSHHKQRGRASFKIGGEERRFPSQLAKDKKSKVCSSARHCLYHREKLKRPFRTNARDKAWCSRCLGFFAIQTVQRFTCFKWGSNPHINNIDPPGMVR
jgi:hypothetical protein